MSNFAHCFRMVCFLLCLLDLWGVVNNAGVCLFAEAEITTVDAFKKMWEVNCLGHFRMVKAFLPLLRKSKGRIVNVTSMCGKLE